MDFYPATNELALPQFAGHLVVISIYRPHPQFFPLENNWPGGNHPMEFAPGQHPSRTPDIMDLLAKYLATLFSAILVVVFSPGRVVIRRGMGNSGNLIIR